MLCTVKPRPQDGVLSKLILALCLSYPYTRHMSQTLDTLVDQIAHHAAPPRGTVVSEFYTDERGDLWVVFVEPDGFTNEQPLACCTVEHGQYVGLPVYREDLD